MLGVMTIPTGLGCKIGGHAGDATPAARLLASACDKLIVHPNVVNASDICELTENMLYVEGSMLDRFLEGGLNLQEVRSNRILIITNSPVSATTANAMNAARVTLGADIAILGLNTPLEMRGEFNPDGSAGGVVTGIDELVEQIKDDDRDAIAIHTPIVVGRDVALRYFREGGVNPWGGIESETSKRISMAIGKPVAHGPIESSARDDIEMMYMAEDKIVNPRMAPEILSTAYLHCVLKGLHKAPRIGKGWSCEDVEFLVVPAGCAGPAHKACSRKGIPIIVVQENTCCLNNPEVEGTIFAESYLDAAGMVLAMRAGVTIESVRANKWS